MPLADDHALWGCLQSNYAINGDEETCEVLIALVGGRVIGLRYSALGEPEASKSDLRVRRRDFIALLGGVTVSGPLVGRAQPHHGLEVVRKWLSK
jgi:hypothetical protein